MRTARLHFRNLSREPLRFYLPQAEAFRAMISDVILKPAHGTALWVPEPRPHGYVITEIDFPLLAPGESRTVTQKFTLDPMLPGRGTTTRRRPGFEAGKQVSVTWVYQNKVTRWQGGLQTLDGPTRTLFEGKPIPHIWTGKLSTKLVWTVPKE